MKLGLVCISEILKSKDKDLAFRTMTRKQFNKLKRDEALILLSKRILHNCRLTQTIVRHCQQNNISHYRVSSNLFPLVTDETLGINYDDLPDIKSIRAALAAVPISGVTMSCHPDQFNVLPSLNPDVVRRTIRELNHQARVLDWMGLEQSFRVPMCLHLGLSPKSDDEVSEFIERFYAAFDQCDDGVKKRLTLENEDKGYWNCKKLFDSFGGDFPLVFDNLHHACNNPHNLSTEECVAAFAKTWGASTPVFHWSEGIDCTRKHTDHFSHVPQFVYDNPNIIFECEVKAKDHAICNILNGVVQ